MHLCALELWLEKRFDCTGFIADLNRAVDVLGEAVTATPLDDPDRADTLSSLGTLLGRRFERTRNMADLDRAVDVLEEAVASTL